MMVDKYEVKKYVASKIGEEHIIKTLGVWDHFDDIDFAQLPNQFVLKCTHDSGGLVICTDKSKLDLAAAKKKIEKSLKNDYYMQNREWPYKNVKRRIIAEEYMVDESGYELKDYKIFAFDGEAKAMFIASDRTNPNEETKFDFFDMDFNHLPFTNGHPNSKEWDKIKRPKGLDEMKKYAEILSKGRSARSSMKLRRMAFLVRRAMGGFLPFSIRFHSLYPIWEKLASDKIVKI